MRLRTLSTLIHDLMKIPSKYVRTENIKDFAVNSLQVGLITVDKLVGPGSSNPSVLRSTDANVVEWFQPSNTPAYLMWKDASSSPSAPKISGTSLPTSPVDGQIFTHTTHKWSYFYLSAVTSWIGYAMHEIDGGDSADTTTGTYLRLYALAPAGARYSATFGWRFNFPVRVVGLQVSAAAAQANSCTVNVTDDGSDVTGGSVSLAASATDAIDETMMSSVIAAGSWIGLRVSGTGPLEGPSAVKARFRRSET